MDIHLCNLYTSLQQNIGIISHLLHTHAAKGGKLGQYSGFTCLHIGGDGNIANR